MDKTHIISSKQTTTTKTSRKDLQARRIKNKNHYILCTQEHTVLRSRHLVITIVSVPGFKELEPTTHITSLSYTTITKPDAIYPTTGEASSIPSRKEIIATSLL